ncbi:DUF6221 family protein [Streptomyces sp. CACIS-1.16CA]|uniref:DUF6221 family protein n=1 Tax=Streptomyces sp. CACIS-1.16CA TaxID=1175510 RepID=UPI0037D901F6
MTDALVAFLKARLDDDAAAIPQGLPDWHFPGSRVVVAEGFDKYDVIDESLKDMLERDESLMPFGCVAVTDYDADAKYIARHDPARTLREVEAKRLIIECHEPWTAGNGDIICGRCGREHIDGRPGGHFPCQTLRLLALPFADHPDYLEEWRP